MNPLEIVLSYLEDEDLMAGFDLGDIIVSLIDSGHIREELLVWARFRNGEGWVAPRSLEVLGGTPIYPSREKYTYIVTANNESIEFEEPETIEDVKRTLDFILTEILLADLENMIRELPAYNASYQQSLIEGNETWSGSSLRGGADGWGSSYAYSRRSLVEKINKTLPDGWDAFLGRVLYGTPRRWKVELLIRTTNNMVILWRHGRFERVLDDEEWK